jgi:pentatricopeptide repeat protein
MFILCNHNHVARATMLNFSSLKCLTPTLDSVFTHTYLPLSHCATISRASVGHNLVRNYAAVPATEPAKTRKPKGPRRPLTIPRFFNKPDVLPEYVHEFEKKLHKEKKPHINQKWVVTLFSQSKFPERKRLVLFRVMRTKGIAGPQVYENMMKFHKYKKNDLDKMFEVFEFMKSDGKATPTAYSLAINTFFDKEQPDKAIELLESAKGTLMDKSLLGDVYFAPIRRFATSGDLNKAVDLFQKMKKEGIAPTSNIYSTLVANHLQAGEAQKAQELYQEMKQNGKQLQPFILFVVLDAFSNTSVQEVLKAMGDDLKQLDIVSFAKRIKETKKRAARLPEVVELAKFLGVSEEKMREINDVINGEKPKEEEPKESAS